MSFFCKAAIYLLVALPAVAKSQAFAKISIRPATSTDPRNMRMQILPNGDLIANGVPVIVLLSYAYDVPVDPSSRLSFLPEWALRDRYDIKGKAIANGISPSLQGNNSQSPVQKRKIRELLADRFKLALRVENKTMSVYILTVGDSGPKLQKSATNKVCTFDTDPGGCHTFAFGFGHPLNAKAADMDDLAHYISNWTDLPVVNRTSLRGFFTFQTEGWLPMRLPPPPPDASPDMNHFASLPTIFTVLGKLGLELHRQESILPVYIVEHIERPATN